MYLDLFDNESISRPCNLYVYCLMCHNKIISVLCFSSTNLRVDENKANIGANENAIAQNKDLLTENQNAIAVNQDAIAENQDRIAENQKAISGYSLLRTHNII